MMGASKKDGKDQESIQSSTTPDPGYQWESSKLFSLFRAYFDFIHQTMSGHVHFVKVKVPSNSKVVRARKWLVFTEIRYLYVIIYTTMHFIILFNPRLSGRKYDSHKIAGILSVFALFGESACAQNLSYSHITTHITSSLVDLSIFSSRPFTPTYFLTFAYILFSMFTNVPV